MLIFWVWAGYLSIFVFDNTLDVGLVFLSIRFFNTLGVGWVSQYSYFIILWMWAGYFSIFADDNTLGVGWVSFNIRFC